MATTLLLLRHAHTEANEDGGALRMAGWSDSSLSRDGEAQLAALSQVSIGEIVPLVYSSTSLRALRTAAAAARGRRVVPLRSLREISCGRMDGMLVADVRRDYPELWERNLAQDDPAFAWPGGESYERFRARVLRTVRAIAARHCGERVLVSTHAGVIAQLIGHAKGVNAARWECYRPANCSLTSVVCDEFGALRVVEFDRRLVQEITRAAASRQRAG